MDGVDFTLRIINEVSRPAREARKSVKEVKDSFGDLQRTARRVRFNPSQHFRRELANLNKVARAQDRVHVQAARQRQRAAIQSQRASQKAHAAQIRAQKARARQVMGDMRRIEVQTAKAAKEAAGRAKMGGGIGQVFDEGGFNPAGFFGGGAGGAAAGIAAGAIVAGLTAIAIAATAAAIAVAKITIAFAQAAVRAAEFAQSSVLALKALTGSAAVGQQQFDEVRQEAVALGLSVHDTVESFKSLLAAQFSIGKSRELIRMSADLQGIGASADETKRALLAISQIKAKGRLMSEELLQLSEAKISRELIFQEVGKQIGTQDVDKIRKAIEKGEIKGDAAIEAILAAVRRKTGVKQAGDLGREVASKTISGLKAQVRGTIDNFFIDIGQAIAPQLSKIVNLALGTFKKITESPEVKRIGELLLSRFKMFGDWVQQNWPMIERTLMVGFHSIAIGVLLAVAATDFIRDHWIAFTPVALGIAFVFGLIGAAVALVVASVVALGVAVMAPFIALGMLIEFMATKGMELTQAGLDWATNLVSGFIQGIRNQFGSVSATVIELANTAKSAFTGGEGIDAQSPSKAFRQFGIWSMEGFEGGMESRAPSIEGASVSMAGESLMAFGGGVAAEGGGGRSVGDIHLTLMLNPEQARDAEAIAKNTRRELELLLSEYD